MAGRFENEDHEAEYRAERRSYLAGLGSAVALTVVAFALIATHAFGRAAVLWTVAALAVVQIVCHFRFFLHIDLSKSKRDDLQLILFSTMILVLMIGGTIWVIGSANMHMG